MNPFNLVYMTLALDLNQVQMQEVSEACSLDDDMVDGDLGDGTEVRKAPSSTRKKSQSLHSVPETPLPGAGEATWIPRLKIAEVQQRARWKLPCSGRNVCELSLYRQTGTKQDSIKFSPFSCSHSCILSDNSYFYPLVEQGSVWRFL